MYCLVEWLVPRRATPTDACGHCHIVRCVGALPYCGLCGGTWRVCAILVHVCVYPRKIVQKEKKKNVVFVFVPFFSGFGRLSRVP